MIRFKAGVRLSGVRPEIIAVLPVVDGAYLKHGVDVCTVTSANDSAHGHGSLHFKGLAIDLRVRNVPEETRGMLFADIMSALTLEFDVLHEYIGTPNEHFHIEWDPKR